jgi:hypothetical protein
MEPIHLRWVSMLFLLCLASHAIAQDRQPGQTPNKEMPALAVRPSLTGKERTGRKWMDDQRIDNCNVPPDKRGSKPRPDDCLHSPSR